MAASTDTEGSSAGSDTRAGAAAGGASSASNLVTYADNEGPSYVMLVTGMGVEERATRAAAAPARANEAPVTETRRPEAEPSVPAELVARTESAT